MINRKTGNRQTYAWMDKLARLERHPECGRDAEPHIPGDSAAVFVFQSS